MTIRAQFQRIMNKNVLKNAPKFYIRKMLSRGACTHIFRFHTKLNSVVEERIPGGFEKQNSQEHVNDVTHVFGVVT